MQGLIFSEMLVWDVEEKAVALSRVSQCAFHSFGCKSGNNALSKASLHLNVLFSCLHNACPNTALTDYLGGDGRAGFHCALLHGTHITAHSI